MSQPEALKMIEDRLKALAHEVEGPAPKDARFLSELAINYADAPERDGHLVVEACVAVMNELLKQTN